jgi:hypothetical protein
VAQFAIKVATTRMGAKFTGIRLKKFHVYILDVIKKLSLITVLVKNIQVSIVLEHFINVRSLQKLRRPAL